MPYAFYPLWPPLSAYWRLLHLGLSNGDGCIHYSVIHTPKETRTLPWFDRLGSRNVGWLVFVRAEEMSSDGCACLRRMTANSLLHRQTFCR